VSPQRQPRKRASERDFLTDFRVIVITVVSWFVLTTAGELIGNQANDTAFGRTIGRYVLLAAIVVLPVALAAWLVLYWRDRRADPPDAGAEEDWPAPRQPPSWQRPGPLYGREREVARAVQTVLDTGVVAVLGPRDIGTSAVAKAVVQRLIDEHGAGADRSTRFDLRSRSARRPDDARAAAGRIVSAFELDEPADGSAALLAGAGQRLLSALRERYDVLMLDNVSVPEEIEWLVTQWPAGGPPWLVVAGGSATRSVVAQSTVYVDELSLAGLRAMWEDELPQPGSTLVDRIRARLRDRWGGGAGNPNDQDALLQACFGRPRAVKAFAAEIRHSNGKVNIDALLDEVRSTGPADGPLERVWTAILDHARDGLSPPAVWLLHALAELPVTALRKDAISAMLSAHRERFGAPAVESSAVRNLLEELRIRYLVQNTDGRFRLPTEVRKALARITPEEQRRAYALEALPVLIERYATQAARTASQLGSDAEAGNWFHDAERSLRPLFSRQTYRDQDLLDLVIDDLASIAASLEAWYVREQQSEGLLAVNDRLSELAERANRPELAGVSAIRRATAHRMAGRLGEAGVMLDLAVSYAQRLRGRPSAVLEMGEHVERALLGMTGSARAGPDRTGLATAEAKLSGVLAAHRRHPGRTAVLINLGALGLHQGRAEDALGYLRRAEELAIEQRDTGSYAHAVELQGVAIAHRPAGLPDAVRLWRQANEWFSRIGEEQGEARCLQHLGAAALTDSAVAGLIRDERASRLTEREAAEVACGLLERATFLRAGQPDTWLAGHYLAIARARTGGS
jgi:hypothetical protein